MDRMLYDEHAEFERDQWWFVGRRAILEGVLIRYLLPAGSRQILDVGCGTGGMLPMLSRFGQVRGMEHEPLGVEYCRTAFPQFEVRQGDIPADVPSDGLLDVVTAFDVIEHIDDDQGALESFRAALQPGGRAVVTVPALSWLWSDHDIVNGHKRRYTRDMLVRAFERSGFEVIHVSSFNTILLPVVAAARLVQRIRRPPVELHSDFTMPSPWMNRMLIRVLSSERSLVAARSLAIGVSLVAVAERPR